MNATYQRLCRSLSFRPLPEALILGAMRAGTTFLYDALSAHPRVAADTIKEHQFFGYRWPEGMRAYRRQLPRRWPDAIVKATGLRRALVIDSSPDYLFHPLAPERAAAVLGPSIKAIVLLREPGARAWSHYCLSLQRGHEHLGFLDAIAAEEERLAGEEARIAAGQETARAPHQIFSYLARGRYADQLQRWFKHIPRERFLVLKSEDLFAQPQVTLDRVCRFLDLDPIALPDRIRRNALPPRPLPPRARAALDIAFAAGNADLKSLTGISFGAGAGASELPRLPDHE